MSPFHISSLAIHQYRVIWLWSTRKKILYKLSVWNLLIFAADFQLIHFRYKLRWWPGVGVWRIINQKNLSAADGLTENIYLINIPSSTFKSNCSCIWKRELAFSSEMASSNSNNFVVVCNYVWYYDMFTLSDQSWTPNSIVIPMRNLFLMFFDPSGTWRTLEGTLGSPFDSELLVESRLWNNFSEPVEWWKRRRLRCRQFAKRTLSRSK